MTGLGEMAAWLSLPDAIPQFCSRYVDDAFGFAVGYNMSAPLSESLFLDLTLKQTRF